MLASISMYQGYMSQALPSAAAAGFTSKQAYKIGIPSIGIVAVLVANVTFIAWATPPGRLMLFYLFFKARMHLFGAFADLKV